MRTAIRAGGITGQPVGVLRQAAVHQVKEAGLDLGGDRAALAFADGTVVEFADRRDFGGGAGEEGFVGDVDVVAGQALGDDFVAQIAASAMIVSRVMPVSAGGDLGS
jgi:hypothetical protein